VLQLRLLKLILRKRHKGSLPLQEPEAQVEAEVLPEAGGPTAPEPQPLEVPSQVPEQAQEPGASLRCKQREPAELAGQIVPVAGGQTEPLPQPQELPEPDQGARVLPTGKTGPSNWQYKVEVKTKKTGRLAKDCVSLHHTLGGWSGGQDPPD
jgi:hypothetical protein